MRSLRPWTKEEDEILDQAIQTQGDEPINWLEVASHLSGRSNKDCRKRWVYSLAPSIRKGSWADWEDTALCEGVRLYGTRAHGRRWTEIVERYFPDRTPIATRNRYDHLRRKRLREDQAVSDELLQRQLMAEVNYLAELA
ncbi:hypothetical protein FE257_008149 [Aspergillus nanangensis]|uniref:Uncharacterized protein n=1 Tax=Aspergillus nanangensis TaxID=2582783 RepID=A0AAD4CM01_ASPNN|nr:hypothetical protein FE257_008149 [Aspergillus nanangensis]